MQILLTSATPFEIAPTLAWLEADFQEHAKGIFEKNGLVVHSLITGVGMTATAFCLGRYLAQYQPDWTINAGIAGTFDPSLHLGDVIQVIDELFGDLGVEEANGQFKDLQELGFASESVLVNPQTPLPNLPCCHGLTVNKVHGSEASIRSVLQKYPDIQVESMEGAAFFYACLASGRSFTEIRSISNQVEPRNRDAWDLPLAIRNLNSVLIEILKAL